MGCAAQVADAETGSYLPTTEDWRAMGRQARDRREAALCLQAAAIAEDPTERRSLQRRAAELIAPHRSSRRRVS